MIINAEGQVLGRFSSFAAKKALLGEDVIVVNAEEAIVSGKKDHIIKSEMDKLNRRNKASPLRGPFHYKRPDRFVRKKIRGMLPWKKPRGREAFKRVMVYTGTPKDEIMKNHNIDVDKEKIQSPDIKKKNPTNYLTVGEICSAIGGSGRMGGK